MDAVPMFLSFLLPYQDPGEPNAWTSSENTNTHTHTKPTLNQATSTRLQMEAQNYSLNAGGGLEIKNTMKEGMWTDRPSDLFTRSVSTEKKSSCNFPLGVCRTHAHVHRLAWDQASAESELKWLNSRSRGFFATPHGLPPPDRTHNIPGEGYSVPSAFQHTSWRTRGK